MNSFHSRFLTERNRAAITDSQLAGPYPNPDFKFIPYDTAEQCDLNRRVVLQDFMIELTKAVDNPQHINDLTLQSSCRNAYVAFLGDLHVDLDRVYDIKMRLGLHITSLEVVVRYKDSRSTTYLLELGDPQELAKALAKAAYTVREASAPKNWECGMAAIAFEGAFLRDLTATVLTIDL